MPRALRSVVIEFAELSDPGRDPGKQVNEDSSGYFETAHGHLLVVCDGMGGHAAGQHASRLAVDTIAEQVRAADPKQPAAQVLGQAVRAAAHAVYQLGGQAPADLRPGSTCVAALIHEAGAEVAHVGDSRLYLLHGGRISRVTRDHSLVQQMVDAGVLTEDEAAAHPEANKITRALGTTPDVEVELRAQPLALQPGDVVLLTSDGLVDLVSDEELSAAIQKHLASGPAVVCQELVALANARGGHDNITLQIAHVLAVPARAPPTMPSATVVDVGDTVPGDDGRERRGAAPPAIVDDSLSAPRNTQPGPPAPGARRPFPDEAPSAAPPRQARQLMLLALLLSLAIVIAIVAWWLSSAVRTSTDKEPPPPPPAAETPRPTRVVPPPPAPAPLVPDVQDEEPASDAAADAGGSRAVAPTE